MDLQIQVYVVAGSLGAAVLLLLVLLAVLWSQLASLRRAVDELQATSRLRVQKLKMSPDKNHAFRSESLAPEEELSRRGYSMYTGDAEQGRPERERQTGGLFVEELTKELDSRQQRQSAPPFLLQSIQENKRQSRSLSNPAAKARASDTNPNFIY